MDAEQKAREAAYAARASLPSTFSAALDAYRDAVRAAERERWTVDEKRRRVAHRLEDMRGGDAVAALARDSFDEGHAAGVKAERERCAETARRTAGAFSASGWDSAAAEFHTLADMLAKGKP